jgi:formamidopyrimidine-DNA glycosylase
MPELPDIQVYLEALDSRVKGRILHRVRIISPFLLRTVEPPVEAAEGKRLRSLRRMGKRIVFVFDGELFFVVHLMIAGRLHWAEAGGKPNAKIGLASFDFDGGTLQLTEAGTKKRASLHVLLGEAALRALDPGGLEVFDSTLAQFREALQRESHTLKRSLTDPALFSGIGNAYSDEILHRAKLSPLANSRNLGDEEIRRLHEATLEILREAITRIRKEAPGEFPEGVTAFRAWHAVHGRFKKPCPVCGAPIQRIRYAENETNYCPRCQTGGKVLADRSLSRLLKDDWPRTLDELEKR